MIKRRKASGQGQQSDEKIANKSQNGDKRRETKFKNNSEKQQQKRQHKQLENGSPEYARQDSQSNHNKATVIIGDSIIKQIDCKTLHGKWSVFA